MGLCISTAQNGSVYFHCPKWVNSLLTWIDTEEYEPPMTPKMRPVVLNFNRGVPPPMLHSYLEKKLEKLISRNFFIL